VIKKLNLNKKKLIILVICLLIGLAIVIKLINYGKDAMKPPVVFLIPEQFIGPVFVVFDQEDGQELKTDPLGVSLTVPENGLIKVKASKNEVLTRGMNYDKRNVYWVTITKDGQRINMPYSGGGGHDYEKRVNWSWYIDTNNQAKQMIFDPKLYPKTNDSDSYFLTKEQAKLKTVYYWDTSRADIWKNPKELEAFNADYNNENRKPGETFNSMSFSVFYPNMNSENIDASDIRDDMSLNGLEEKLTEIIPLKLQYLKEYLELNKNKKD
jgi:hypothetical protein